MPANLKASPTNFDLALIEAKRDFLGSVKVEFTNDPNLSFGVRCTRFDKHSTLNVPDAPPEFIGALTACGVPEQTAWYLAFAHEYGHLVLNAECLLRKTDPANPNEQLKSIPVDLTIFDIALLPSFHKETALEAYCDAHLAKLASQKYGDQWMPLIEIICKIREANSIALGPSAQDEYQTAPVLRQMLALRRLISSDQAALLALRNSQANFSFAQNTAFGLSERLLSLPLSLIDRLIKKRNRSPSPPNPPASPPPPKSK